MCDGHAPVTIGLAAAGAAHARCLSVVIDGPCSAPGSGVGRGGKLAQGPAHPRHQLHSRTEVNPLLQLGLFGGRQRGLLAHA